MFPLFFVNIWSDWLLHKAGAKELAASIELMEDYFKTSGATFLVGNTTTIADLMV